VKEIGSILNKLKTEVKDGNSKLYELNPFYLSLNLGRTPAFHCNDLMNTSKNKDKEDIHDLKNFRLIKREGV
jgi:hypothetical protein